MKILVKSLAGGKALEFDLNENSTIGDLKKLISLQQKIADANVKLILSGKTMVDNLAKISELKIGPKQFFVFIATKVFFHYIEQNIKEVAKRIINPEEQKKDEKSDNESISEDGQNLENIEMPIISKPIYICIFPDFFNVISS